MKTLLVAAAILLGACSPLDILTKLDDKPSIDAQIGDTTNKVKTGLGNLGNKSEIKVEDSTDTNVSTSKYHLESKDNLTVNIHETNKWILPVVGLYIFGRPLFKWLADKLLARLRRKRKWIG